MYVGYYVGDRFPFPQASGGPFMAFPGTPQLCATSQSKADTLGFYRPNQAVQRIYMRGLGQSIDLADPTTLALLGGGALAAWWLFKKRRGRNPRRRRNRR
jgi:hypothetical protein